MRSLFDARDDGTPLVKICGLQHPQDVEAAVLAGADLVGIVFAPSKRQVTPAVAKLLVEAAAGAVPVAGVFVDASVEDICAIVRDTGISCVQLSGSAGVSPALRTFSDRNTNANHGTRGALARDLFATEDAQDPCRPVHPLHVPVIKVIHTGAERGAPAPLHINTWYPTATALLVDSWSLQGGGSGRVADWEAANALVRASCRPVLLAGGLRPDNVIEALRLTGSAGVDVSSGVERNGRKDADLMQAFVHAVRQISVYRRKDD